MNSEILSPVVKRGLVRHAWLSHAFCLLAATSVLLRVAISQAAVTNVAVSQLPKNVTVFNAADRMIINQTNVGAGTFTTKTFAWGQLLSAASTNANNSLWTNSAGEIHTTTNAPIRPTLNATNLSEGNVFQVNAAGTNFLTGNLFNLDNAGSWAGNNAAAVGMFATLPPNAGVRSIYNFQGVGGLYGGANFYNSGVLTNGDMFGALVGTEGAASLKYGGIFYAKPNVASTNVGLIGTVLLNGQSGAHSVGTYAEVTDNNATEPNYIAGAFQADSRGTGLPIATFGTNNGVIKVQITAAGDLKIVNGAAAGYALLSDASGVGSWQPFSSVNISNYFYTNIINQFRGKTVFNTNVYLTTDASLNLSNVAPLKILRTTADSSVGVVTVGSGLSFDGTTLSANSVTGTSTVLAPAPMSAFGSRRIVAMQADGKLSGSYSQYGISMALAGSNIEEQSGASTHASELLYGNVIDSPHYFQDSGGTGGIMAGTKPSYWIFHTAVTNTANVRIYVGLTSLYGTSLYQTQTPAGIDCALFRLSTNSGNWFFCTGDGTLSQEADTGVAGTTADIHLSFTLNPGGASAVGYINGVSVATNTVVPNSPMTPIFLINPLAASNKGLRCYGFYGEQDW